MACLLKAPLTFLCGVDMPFPIIAVGSILASVGSLFRIGSILTFFGGLFASVVGFLATWLTKRIAITLVVVSLVAGLTGVMFISIKAIISSIVVVVSPDVQTALNMITPDNFWVCFSALFSAKLIRWVWAWKVHFVEMYANGS